MSADKKKDDDIVMVQRNRKAGFKYEITDRCEAGIVLTGSEVKSIREGQVSIHEAYARIRRGEVWVHNLDIAPYKQAGPFNHEPKRKRKLLLHRSEIRRMAVKTQERGLTLVPLSLYFKNGFAKLEIGVGRGKNVHDKRDTIRKRENDRELRRGSRH